MSVKDSFLKLLRDVSGSSPTARELVAVVEREDVETRQRARAEAYAARRQGRDELARVIADYAATQAETAEQIRRCREALATAEATAVAHQRVHQPLVLELEYRIQRAESALRESAPPAIVAALARLERLREELAAASHAVSVKTADGIDRCVWSNSASLAARLEAILAGRDRVAALALEMLDDETLTQTIDAIFAAIPALETPPSAEGVRLILDDRAKVTRERARALAGARA